MSSPTPLCLDNHGSVFLSVNPVVDRRTKHIEISEDQLADCLTKNVPLNAIEKFRSFSGMFVAS
ncbi:hypothetical protein DAEQUDRAFT_767980 [Daedalea quercina L-15889]|uniref:Uncharacterized protein n=1 Tax=Daedalea quercina L-15889 TaxID=1314783 RepID=A0A165N4U4_9APHY|nr:hypothetical protein DAEQUDRAFT_767980 [Daedalea quercina L-15889]